LSPLTGTVTVSAVVPGANVRGPLVTAKSSGGAAEPLAVA
jgi:hypothetical protein